ncbi:MAG: ORF6N domain-containing protein [candidate division WOR-3 bacterium]|nr:ORF6N domain-containing protein [candidate division WOR-3 bacterium]
MSAPRDSGYLIPVEQLDRAIVEVRGKRVILSHDLAAAYGVSAKRLNEQVKRNIERFPDDFMFQLTPDEKAEVVANCDHLALLKFSPSLPYAFTEHGAVMAACVLNSKRAVEVSVFVVRAFVRMSRILASHRQLALKLAELEARVSTHDRSIQSLLGAIRSLITPPAPPRRKIGFATNPDDNIIAHDRPVRRHRKP